MFLKKYFIKKINSNSNFITASFPPKSVQPEPDKFSPRQDKKGAFCGGGPLNRLTVP